MGWILNIIALILFVVLHIVDIIVRLFTKRSENSAYSNGFKINVFGNELFANTLNIILLKKGVNIFGVFGEPLSSVLGKSYRDNQLNYFGHTIRFLIDAFDIGMWIKGKSHCLYWIRDKKEIKKYKSTIK